MRPLERHRDAADHRSALASATIPIGSRHILALSDGVLVMPPTFIGTPTHPTAAHDVLADAGGRAPLPLGCFLIPGDTTVLVDTGFGPHDHGDRGVLVGGALLTAMARHGFQPTDIDMIALSHLHLDHVGWIADLDGRPVFPDATIAVGRRDWEFFIESDTAELPLPPHIKAGLLALAEAGRVQLLDEDGTVAPGITRLAAPGHTPGHSVYVISDDQARALLLGDALYCPQQMTHTDWAALTDVDPVLARQTRERLIALLDGNDLALGCHFPDLQAGRVLMAER